VSVAEDEDDQLRLQFEPLVVVEVVERFSAGLTGRSDRRYRSPPQLRDHAVCLAALLLGAPSVPDEGCGPWTSAVAGGRRTVTLIPAAGSEPRH
jgi:hypothetical protein